MRKLNAAEETIVGATPFEFARSVTVFTFTQRLSDPLCRWHGGVLPGKGRSRSAWSASGQDGWCSGWHLERSRRPEADRLQ